MMAMMSSSFCRKASGKVNTLQAVLVRGFHMDTNKTHHDGNHEMLYDMISSGTHSSTERITKFMNGLYVSKPRSVSLFSFNYRQQSERSTIRGICIGTNSRRGPAQKNVVVVSGVPLQDPSVIGVGLYVAAMLSRLSPMLPRDVSVIPLASPREYEQRWMKTAIARQGKVLFDRSAPELDSFSSFSESVEAAPNWLAHENVTLDLKDTCKPLETYITRKNKYFINLDVSLTAQGSSMSYKGNSLSSIASKGKFRDFFSQSSSPSLSLPSHLLPSTPSSSSSMLIPEPKQNTMLDSITEAPTIVMELKGNVALDDEQVVVRGEEIIQMLKELLAPAAPSPFSFE